ncbi:hypothetical protein BJ508DRAFT_335627 [Ascobolus immersus RN42]|uniref:Uncharacterized protein n=1 Tax=Ascobolus immersus RN42 TaxID=1160509 RepID=A0A3N4HBP7_ASCIM|nr:hypothetical protein BJ508DRAFT_335627 [Ascobolus immersus RN42]
MSAIDNKRPRSSSIYDDTPDTKKAKKEELVPASVQTDPPINHRPAPNVDLVLCEGDTEAICVLSIPMLDVLMLIPLVVMDPDLWSGLDVLISRRGHTHSFYLKYMVTHSGQRGLVLTWKKKLDGEQVEVYGGWIHKENRKYKPLKDMVKAGMFIWCNVRWWRKYTWVKKSLVCWEGAVEWQGYISESYCTSMADEFSEDGYGDSDEGTDEEV